MKSDVKSNLEKMRKDFESLDVIKKLIPNDTAFIYSSSSNLYFDYHDNRDVVGFINGAWWAYQLQQERS